MAHRTRPVELSAAAIMWTVVVALAVAGTVVPEPLLRFWALLVSMPALLVSGHLVMLNVVHAERVCLEVLVDGLVARARERADAEVPRIRGR